MPEFLGNPPGHFVSTQNDYVPELQLGPAVGVEAIRFSVLGANPALVQA